MERQTAQQQAEVPEARIAVAVAEAPEPPELPEHLRRAEAEMAEQPNGGADGEEPPAADDGEEKST
jgi:hypothetical protein